MQYIIMDMEWNQAWPGSYAAQRPLPVPIHGEVIQIGAVRMLEDQTLADEFQVLIRPKYYRRLNSRISKLTGIKEARLRSEGLSFDDAINEFYNWCGDDCVFLTWGFDDMPILEANMLLNGYDPVWIQNWYNAQMFFNTQTDTGNNQKSLSSALELMGIPSSRPAHDALGDAYHTALICKKLDIERGIREYPNSLKAHEDGFHGAQLPGCVSRKVYHGYEGKVEAMGDMSGKENFCPLCGKSMSCGTWKSQGGRRYLTKAVCKKDGPFVIRIRFDHEKDGAIKVCRLVYDSSSDVFKNYDAEIAKKPHRSRRKRRHKPTNNPI